MRNKDRFSDENGKPLLIVQELKTYIEKRKELDTTKIKTATSHPVANSGLSSSQTDEGGSNSAVKDSGLKGADATMDNSPEQTSETLHTSDDNISPKADKVKEEESKEEKFTKDLLQNCDLNTLERVQTNKKERIERKG